MPLVSVILGTDADAAALIWASRRAWREDKETKRLERRLKEIATQVGPQDAGPEKGCRQRRRSCGDPLVDPLQDPSSGLHLEQ